MRLVLKLGIGASVTGLILIALLMLKFSLEAKRLDVGWSRRVPIDRSIDVVDDPAASAIAGSLNHRFVALHKGATGELLWRYAVDLFAKGRVVGDVSISADGSTIAAVKRGGEIIVFDRFANRKGSIKTAAPVQALALSGDGRRLARTSSDGQIFLGNTSGGELRLLDVGERPLYIKLNGAGDQILVATRKSIALMRADGEAIWSRRVSLKAVSSAPNLNRVAVITGSGMLGVLDRSGQWRWKYTHDTSLPRLGSVALSRRGYVAAAGSGHVYLFGGDGRLINSFPSPLPGARALGFAGNGRVLVTAGAGALSGLKAGEAIARAARSRRASRWGVPAIFICAALTVGARRRLRRLSPTGAEIVELHQGREKKERRRKAA